MADPADLLKAWQHAIRDLGGVATSLASGPAGAAGDLVRPLQHQAELLQQVLQRQLEFEFERDLLGRATAPLHAAQDLVDQATGTFRAQATLVSGGLNHLRPARWADGSAGRPPGTRRHPDARPAHHIQIH
jgi:hypothetical protein